MVPRLLFAYYRWISSARFWMRRRFTKCGWLLLGSLFVTIATGAQIRISVAYQAYTFIVGLLGVAMLGAVFFRGRFSFQRHLPKFGSVGEPLSYFCLVQNKSPRRWDRLTLLEDLADPRPNLEEFKATLTVQRKYLVSFSLAPAAPRFIPARLKEQPLPPLPVQGIVEVAMEITPTRRGPLRFAGATIARADPFGVFRAFASMACPQTVLILPKRYPIPPIAMPGTLKYQPGGVAQASSVGESEEFVALREYRRGDPLRHIHWKSWAKTGKPIVKEFQDEFFVRHALVLDTFGATVEEEVFEAAVSIAASFASTLQSQESLLDLLFVGPQAYCFTTGRGLAHTDQMLEILASVQPCRERPFQSLRHLVLEHLNLVSGSVCIFLTWDEERQQLVQRIKESGIPLLVLIVTEPGQSSKLDPGPLRDQPEAFHPVEIGKITEGLANL